MRIDKDFDELNQIYSKLNKKRDEMLNSLMNGEGYEIAWGFFSHHFYKVNETFLLEEYPIPVITINDYIDIGIDLDEIFIEAHLSKDIMLLIDYSIINRPFDVYGLEEFYDDIHNSSMDLLSIKDRIEASNEEEFGLSFSFDFNEDIDSILDFVSIIMHL